MAANDMAVRWYNREFPKESSTRQLDYFQRVLQMELFIRAYTDITNCEFDEADLIMRKIFYNIKKR